MKIINNNFIIHFGAIKVEEIFYSNNLNKTVLEVK